MLINEYSLVQKLFQKKYFFVVFMMSMLLKIIILGLMLYAYWLKEKRIWIDQPYSYFLLLATPGIIYTGYGNNIWGYFPDVLITTHTSGDSYYSSRIYLFLMIICSLTSFLLDFSFFILADFNWLHSLSMCSQISLVLIINGYIFSYTFPKNLLTRSFFNSNSPFIPSVITLVIIIVYLLLLDVPEYLFLITTVILIVQALYINYQFKKPSHVSATLSKLL